LKTPRKKRTGKPGRKRPAGEAHLLKQVEKVFSDKKEELGAQGAADDLGIGLASLYNYAGGKTIPDMKVLQKVVEKWKIRWDYLDPAEVLRTKKVDSPEQYVLNFLEEIRPKDIEVVKVGPKGVDSLHITLKIRFSA
jgi:hypothetical protein